MATKTIQISAGYSTCIVHPEIGGSIGRWAVNGQEIMRAASQHALESNNPLGMACFPLVPYSNRIGHGKFEWNHKTVSVRQNFAPEPHAIHGTGWRNAWHVDEHATSNAILSYEHFGNEDWPWRFKASQTFRLLEDALSLTLHVCNLEDEPTPLAFGLHPYFNSAGAKLKFYAKHIWQNGADFLPSHKLEPQGDFDFMNLSAVQGRTVDHCFSGCDGTACIEWGNLPLALNITSKPAMQAAVVYIPSGQDYFCFEPVPHINNALNLPSELPTMPILGAKESYETEIYFQTHLAAHNRDF
jgi:aldose 1-epimerase